MTINDMYTAAADQARSAVDRSAQVWKDTTEVLNVQAISPLQNMDLGGALQRYVEYVRDGIEVNWEFTRRWVKASMLLSDVARDHLNAVNFALNGHGTAISTWLSDEADLLSGTK